MEVKGVLGLLIWIFAVGFANWAQVPLTSGFPAAVIIAVTFFLVVQVLQDMKFGEKSAMKFFMSAAGFALFTASFEILGIATKTFPNAGQYITYLISLGYALTWLTAFLGAIVMVLSLFK